MEGEIGTFSEDLLQFVSFVLSALFSICAMQRSKSGEVSPTLKEISNGTALNGQCLFACLPHPGGHGGDLWNHLSPGFSFWKTLRTNGTYVPF